MLRKEHKTYLIQFLLFVVTLFTTTITGAEFVNFESVQFLDEKHQFIKGSGLDWFLTGLWYSIPFLGVLTIHEFGHFFMAKFYKLKVTLPYYIPFWFPGMLSIGTMGAVIKLKSPTHTKRQFFDIGIAGPLAGFVAAFVLLWYGFSTLPSYKEIELIHPEYSSHIIAHGAEYAESAISDLKESGHGMLFGVGDNLLFTFFKTYVAPNPDDVPNEFEIMHYPFIFAGYLALFFTALNLLPIGQLDGGHVLYGLFGGKLHDIISKIVFVLFITWAGIGFMTPYQPLGDMIWKLPLYGAFLYYVMFAVFKNIQTALVYALGVFALQFIIAALYPAMEGFHGWLLFAFVIARVLGVSHPKAYIEEPLDLKRKVLGWVCIVVFILCFSPKPFIMEAF